MVQDKWTSMGAKQKKKSALDGLDWIHTFKGREHTIAKKNGDIQVTK